MQYPWLSSSMPHTPNKSTTAVSNNNLAWVALILSFCFEIASQLNAQTVSEDDSPATVYQSAMQRERLHNAAVFTLLVGIYCVIAVRL